LKKEIDLEMLGADTELDRQVIEVIKGWMQVVNASWLSFLRPSKFPKGY